MDDSIMESGLQVERQWSEYFGLNTLADINDKIAKGWLPDVIQVCEAMHDRRMVQIAEHIKNSGKRLILLAGPSSSGKTTSARKLCIQLWAEGVKPIYIGIDDYYKERDDIPFGEDGLRDFESVSAIDTELFNKQIEELLAGKTVDVPHFDFITGKKVFGTRKVSAAPDRPIVLEGILALTDELTAGLPEDQKFRIYTCPLSSLKQTDGSKVKRTDIRKLRRLIRDHAKRGWNLEQTFDMWPKVRSGEDENIFPYSKTADEIFNSSQPYELSVIKKHAMPLLLEVTEGSKYYAEARRLIKLLDQVESMEDESVIEGDSVIREFIGGGQL